MVDNTYSFKAKGQEKVKLQDGVEETVRFDNRYSAKKNDTKAKKVVKNFVLGEDVAEFRIDGDYFEGSDIAYNPYNDNLARVSTAADFLDLMTAVLSDDGKKNKVKIKGNDLFLRIDADNHKWREDLKIKFVGVVDQIGAAFGLDTNQTFDDIIVGTNKDDFLHRGNGIGYSQEGGDDLLVGGGGADVFQFNSTGTFIHKNDGFRPTDHVADLNFVEGDVLRFSDWGHDAFGRGSGNRVDITSLEELEAFGNMLNSGHNSFDEEFYLDSMEGMSHPEEYAEIRSYGYLGMTESSAYTSRGNVYLNIEHATQDRSQTIVLHGLGDQVSFQSKSAQYIA